MGVLDSFLNMMRLNPDDEEDFYDDDYYEEEEPPVIKKSSHKEKDDPIREAYGTSGKEKKTSQKITPMRPVKKQTNGMEVCVIKPVSVEDAREIAETLLSERAVVLNVEGLDVDIAQRIIDFTSGSCFAISGNLQKISNYIFIVTPSSVDISGDFLDLVDSFSGTGIHTNI